MLLRKPRKNSGEKQIKQNNLRIQRTCRRGRSSIHNNGNNNSYKRRHRKTGELLKELTEIMFGKIIEPWKYKLWLLYETKQIRGIWHVKYYPYRPRYVKYTHPDNYIHYDISVDGWWEKGDPSYLAVVHIPPWAVALSAAALGALLGEMFGGHLAAAIGAVLAVAFEIAGVSYMSDENGEGWFWAKDYKQYKL